MNINNNQIQQGKTRLQDIAEAVGCSVSTVSRALRGDSRISVATRRLVELEAQRLNYPYTPVLVKTSRSGTHDSVSVSKPSSIPGLKKLAVVMRADNHKDFFAETLLELIEQGRQRSFSVNLDVCHGPIALCLAQQNADAIILILWKELTEDEGLMLQSHSVPVVLVNRHVEGITNSVTLDNFASSLQAIRYLKALGHQRIAYIPGPQSVSAFRERADSFRHGLELIGFYNNSYFAKPIIGSLVEAVRNEVIRLLKLTKPPTAIATFNDSAASIALMTARDLGFKVPTDLSILGFDYSQEFRPYGITTFDFRRQELGRMAIHLLEGLITHKIEGPVHIRVAPRLIERSTVGEASAT